VFLRDAVICIQPYCNVFLCGIERHTVGSIQNAELIRVGVLAEEPLRLEGLAGIFEGSNDECRAPLSPVMGDFEELMSDSRLRYLIVDLHSFQGAVEILQKIRGRRPGLRLIVIGPEGDDKLALDSIIAGARAYLDLKASPQTVRKAVDVVIGGSIWAPRRLLSQLIDRLLAAKDSSLTNSPPHLTDRERQVLEKILLAHSNREIASELGIEESTVQAHVGRLMRKAGAVSRIELLMRASKPELLEAAGITDRRQRDHRGGPSASLALVTHE
jgi:DNA-binding NarL/FixJ family response regulator